MSDDLISRSELMRKLLINSKGQTIPEVDCDNFPINLTIREVKDLVRNQPIAYDVDGVTAELEEYIEEYSMVDEDGLHNSKWCAMKEALDVVKGGAK